MNTTQLVVGVELTHVATTIDWSINKRMSSVRCPVSRCPWRNTCRTGPAGTNRAALEAGVDLLAHPGLLLKRMLRSLHKKAFSLSFLVVKVTV